MNIRDASVDAWRPGILFLLSDITASLPSLHFVNDLKKSGLLVLGWVGTVKIEISQTFRLYKFCLNWADIDTKLGMKKI